MLDKTSGSDAGRQPQEARREQLIHATITAIAEHGLSNVTLSKVGAEVGLTAAMINFHFDSKQALLTETLKYIADEYADVCEAAIAAAGDEPYASLMALITASFDPQICEPGRVSVWYAFWGESRSRGDYMAICGHSDRAFEAAVLRLMEQLTEQTGSDIAHAPAAPSACQVWLTGCGRIMLVDPDKFDHASAIEMCRAYLVQSVSVLQGRCGQGRGAETAEEDELPRTLPAWTYTSEGFFKREIEQIHKPAWHLVCHVSDVPNPGDYFTFTGLGERAFVIRGEDGELRAFHNVCPHRPMQWFRARTAAASIECAAPITPGPSTFSGDLVAIASRKTFPPFDDGQFGLRPLEIEVFMGLVFIRFRPGGASVAERYAPLADELAAYRIEDMEPLTDFHESPMEADWKNVWDNYLEDYHFPTGHPGLFGLMTQNYDREPDDETRTIRLSHEMRDKPKGGWSVQNYAKLLPAQEHLPEGLRKRWSYFFMYPAVSLDIYPERIDFFHVVPTGPGRSVLRCGAYALPNASREIKACQFLGGRINWEVHQEDMALIESVQGGLSTSAYDTGVLGDKEIAPLALQRWVAEDLPEAVGPEPL